MKDYRIFVQTNDGCITIWYERSNSKATNVCATIQERVYNQLCGLNLKEVSVTVM